MTLCHILFARHQFTFRFRGESLSCFLQTRKIVGITGGNFEERHIQLIKKLHGHLLARMPGSTFRVCPHCTAKINCANKRCTKSSIESLFTSICQKKHYLYRKNDLNKKRKNLVQKISQLKQRLLTEIGRYNQLPDVITVDDVTVVQKLSSKSEDKVIWPWQEQSADGVPLLDKKRLFDQQMLLSRLLEEKQILLKEMMQHCKYIRDSMGKVHSLMTTILNPRSESCMTGFSEEGSRGLVCMLKGTLADLKGQKKTVLSCYRAILDSEPKTWFEEEDSWEEEEMEIEEERDWWHDSSSDSEEDEEDEVQSC